MNKQFIIIPGLLVIGILVGIAIMNARDNGSPVQVKSTGEAPVVSSQPPSSNPWTVIKGTESPRVNKLENRVSELESRLSELELTMHAQSDAIKTPPEQSQARTQYMNRLLTTRALVKAGISEDRALDIVRRKNDIELRKLELHDRATREGYLGSKQYMSELSAISAEETSVREDLGDEAYDQYLYANGRPNRVKVASVMLGSPAEQAGMKEGDLILTYGQNRMFEGGELQQATSEGELGEFLSLDIMRNGQLMSLWVPRGPLGIRLATARVKP